MRPLRLQIENLASFRDKHGPLDFSRFDLFAIAGPTGAGKSSLLDAIVFALYGRTPRLGANLTEMIALGKDRLAVTFDFSSAGKTYRVARALHRNRKTKVSEAALEELVGDQERAITDGAASVNKALERIVGLSYDAFTQAVILPQGDFQRFLKSAPGPRRAILANLLRMQVYERMHGRARDEEVRLAATVQGGETLLAGDAEAATPEVIEAARDRLAALRARLAALSAAVTTQEGVVQELRQGRHKTRELRDAEEKLRGLLTRERAVKESEDRLATASRAEGVRPRLDNLEKAREQLKSWTDRWEKTRRAEAETALQEDRAQRALRAAQKGVTKVLKLEARIRAIDEISGLLEPRDAARKRADEAEKRYADADRALQLAREQEKQAGGKARATAEAARATAAKISANGYDAATHERLESLREAALILGQVRAAWQRAEVTARAATEEVRRAEVAETARKKALESAQKTAHQAAEARHLAEATERKTERDHAVAHLRASLATGQACPVCEQAVARLPPAPSVGALDAVRQQVVEARDRDQLAQAAVAEARGELAEATATQRKAHEAAMAAERDAKAAAQALVEADLRLGESAGADLGPRSKTPLEERLKAALDRFADRKKSHEALRSERERADREHERAGLELERAKEKGVGLATDLVALETEKDAAHREAKELAQRIEKVLRGASPERERASLEAEKAGLQAALLAAQKAEREAAAERLEVKTQRDTAQRSMIDAQRALAEESDALDKALREAGFESAPAATRAVLAADVVERLRGEVETHRRDAHATTIRVDELKKELKQRLVEEAELRDAELALVTQRSELASGRTEEGRLTQSVADLQERAERLRALGVSIERDRKRHATFQRLTTDLRSENFRAFVLEEAFQELVVGASARLLALTDRYSFEFKDDSFHVLDHDNADERRSAETLSGGETFLASLALALELSQQIQRAAGAVHLDSLFIDEGFGTLDPETLDTIAGALEDLQVGGRMVGIITHLPELTERIPNRVRVEKRPEGARFRVETA